MSTGDPTSQLNWLLHAQTLPTKSSIHYLLSPLRTRQRLSLDTELAFIIITIRAYELIASDGHCAADAKTTTESISRLASCPITINLSAVIGDV